MFQYNDIFSISSDKQFHKIALKVFRYQYENNSIYRQFCNYLHIQKEQVKSLEQIPFLPIAFFKSHEVVSCSNTVREIFTSSGTTGMQTSKHLVTDINWYKESYYRAFAQFYGDIENYAVLALLPSYLDRKGSSLIYMVNDLIEKSNHHDSGFYLRNHDELLQKLEKLNHNGQNVILIGVTYALLDLIEYAESTSFPLSKLGGNLIIMETGGMKGQRKELIREELHTILCTGFGVQTIHSEYGMTELLSQAYSFGNGIFETPNWMKIMVRDTEDALSYVTQGKTGGINVIDLANINSCSFIATQDLGKTLSSNSFEVLGRFDNSDIRGCNLMVL
ncbi:acyl-protein synthetase LuxE [Flavobacterium croceum DSM 17960]|uniref:Acyl-protein synthetase LuxE n=1 Tax=Flavobacterium croceum DSM 17960 TaxID=1121886 RepID=A0A2S4N782_9FLAO|nr:acyl transferase [Flavobacterium croceum]POS01213.1 acyl-protein synthetase LuxE [Flavobacterium croceum DSM 17960]